MSWSHTPRAAKIAMSVLVFAGCSKLQPSGRPEAVGIQSAAPAGPVSASSAAPAAPAPASPFRAVASLPGAFKLYPVDGALLVASATGLNHEDAARWLGADAAREREAQHYLSGTPVGIVEGGKACFPRDMLIGNEASNSVYSIDGRWPGGIRALVAGLWTFAYTEPYLLTDRGWIRVPVARKSPLHWVSGREYWFGRFIGLAQSGGRVFGMTDTSSSRDDARPEILDLTGRDAKEASLLLQPADRAQCRDAGEGRQWVAVQPFAFGAAADGRILSVGSTCKGGVAVEVWRRGAATSQIHEVAGITLEGSPEGVVMIRGTGVGVWVLGNFVLHDDGARTVVIDNPSVDGLRAGAVTSDGALWAVGGKGTVHRRSSEGTWETVVLPGGVAADDVAVYQDALYVSAGGVLFRHGAAGAPEVVPTSP